MSEELLEIIRNSNDPEEAARIAFKVILCYLAKNESEKEQLSDLLQEAG